MYKHQSQTDLSMDVKKGHEKEKQPKTRVLFLWVRKAFSLCSKAKHWISSVVGVSLYQLFLLTRPWEMWEFLGEIAGELHSKKKGENPACIFPPPMRCMKKNCSLWCQGFNLYWHGSLASGTLWPIRSQSRDQWTCNKWWISLYTKDESLRLSAMWGHIAP